MAKTAKPNRAAAEQAPPKRMLVDPRSAEALTTTPSSTRGAPACPKPRGETTPPSRTGANIA